MQQPFFVSEGTGFIYCFLGCHVRLFRELGQLIVEEVERRGGGARVDDVTHVISWVPSHRESIPVLYSCCQRWADNGVM